MSVIEAVFFDLGETLVNEGEIYGRWADWLRVPRHTFNAVLGGAIARGDSYLAVFEHFRPGFLVDGRHDRIGGKAPGCRGSERQFLRRATAKQEYYCAPRPSSTVLMVWNRIIVSRPKERFLI